MAQVSGVAVGIGDGCAVEVDRIRWNPHAVVVGVSREDTFICDVDSCCCNGFTAKFGCGCECISRVFIGGNGWVGGSCTWGSAAKGLIDAVVSTTETCLFGFMSVSAVWIQVRFTKTMTVELSQKT